MATDYCVLTRPFYMDTADVDFSVDIGGGAVAKSCFTGSHASYTQLMYNFEALLDTVGVFAVTVDSDGKIVVTRTGGNFQITAMDTRLRKILGFETTNSMFTGGAATYTADYTPLYAWFPETVRVDRDRWAHIPTVAATEMINGSLSASSTGDVLYQIELAWEMEPRYLMYRSAGRTEVEKDRSLDTFIWGGGTVVTEGIATAPPGAAGEPPLDGFYVWPDRSEVTKLSTMDAGGADSFELTSSAEVYAWCQVDSDYLRKVARRRHSIPVLRNFYGDALPIHSVSSVPTWVVFP